MWTVLKHRWHAVRQRWQKSVPTPTPTSVTLSPDLVHRLSHEMRTSLTGIVGYAEFIEEGAEPALVNFTAKIIRESGQELVRSVQSFVDLYQVMASPAQRHASEFSVAALVHDLVAQFQTLADQRDVSLIFNGTQESQSALMCSDQHRFRQMLETLIGFSLRSATRGAVVVVRLALHSPQEVALTIYELGAAAQPVHSQLLQAFWQDPHYVYQLQEGPGVDMALAKVLVAQLQGRAVFKTLKGQGDQLRLWFPLRGDAAM